MIADIIDELIKPYVNIPSVLAELSKVAYDLGEADKEFTSLVDRIREELRCLKECIAEYEELSE